MLSYKNMTMFQDEQNVTLSEPFLYNINNLEVKYIKVKTLLK